MNRQVAVYNLVEGERGDFFDERNKYSASPILHAFHAHEFPQEDFHSADN